MWDQQTLTQQTLLPAKPSCNKAASAPIPLWNQGLLLQKSLEVARRSMLGQLGANNPCLRSTLQASRL
eukprot:2558976-Rhodomonas_salina.1